MDSLKLLNMYTQETIYSWLKDDDRVSRTMTKSELIAHLLEHYEFHTFSNVIIPEKCPQYIRTFTGRRIKVWPDESQIIPLEELVKSLCFINRFNGHVGHYSVAEHSIMCHDIAKALHPKFPSLWRCCLLHDLHEAILGDITRPMKGFLGEELSLLTRMWDKYIDQHYHTNFDAWGPQTSSIDHAATLVEISEVCKWTDELSIDDLDIVRQNKKHLCRKSGYDAFEPFMRRYRETFCGT